MKEYLLNNWLEILGTITGIIYLYQELKASIWMWVTGIIMPAISLFVYYEAGLYADFGINIYYLIAAIYGFCVWQFAKREDETELPITHTPTQRYLPLTFTFIFCFIAIGFILQTYTDSTVPWWDSFTTALSIVGMWMLARKWLEQWWAWVVVDAVSAGLYLYKGIYFYAALYALYTFIAIYGYFKWKRLMTLSSSQQETTPPIP
ncbi:MAG: nicotinamide mononucleotide transporter [Bacteroidaceae bacterium]|nr:nicotinamide mononucleotide transporter [Bacteroidaceae bacterium]